MQVRSGMSTSVVTVAPGCTLHDAAKAMADRRVGAAVVIDPEQPGPGIITERDVLMSVGAGQNPDTEVVSDHLSSALTFASRQERSTSIYRQVSAATSTPTFYAPAKS